MSGGVLVFDNDDQSVGVDEEGGPGAVVVETASSGVLVFEEREASTLEETSDGRLLLVDAPEATVVAAQTLPGDLLLVEEEADREAVTQEGEAEVMVVDGGRRGLPGSPGEAGPQGPPGDVDDPDLPDLVLLFENGLL